MVWPYPISSGWSPSENNWASSGTKNRRGTRPNAASTRESRIPCSMSRRTSGPSRGCGRRPSMLPNLPLVREVRKPDAVSLGIPDVKRPARPVHDRDSQRGELLLPGLALAGHDAQRQQVQSTVAVPERRGRTFRVARFQRQELLSRTHRQPHRSFAGAAVFPRPAPQDAKPERLDVEALRGGKVFHLDGEMVMSVDLRHRASIKEPRHASPRADSQHRAHRARRPTTDTPGRLL